MVRLLATRPHFRATARAAVLSFAPVAFLGCLGGESASALREVGAPAPMIYVSLAKPANAANDSYDLVFSAPVPAAAVGYCTSGDAASCTPSSASYYATKKIHDNGSKRFFQTEAPVVVTEAFNLTVVALDTANATLGNRTLVFNKIPAAAGGATPTTNP